MNRVVSRAVRWIRNGSEVLGRPQLTGALAASNLKPAEYLLQPSSTHKVTVLGSVAAGTVVSCMHRSLYVTPFYFAQASLP